MSICVCGATAQVIATPTPIIDYRSFLGVFFRLYKCFRKFPRMEKIKSTTPLSIYLSTVDRFGIILINDIHRTLLNKIKYILPSVDANNIVIDEICALTMHTCIRKIIGMKFNNALYDVRRKTIGLGNL